VLKVVFVFKREGAIGFFRAAVRFFKHKRSYARFVKRQLSQADYLRREQRQGTRCLALQPLISVLIPTYNPPIHFLNEAIGSVVAQIYPNWELCIADDASPNPVVRSVLLGWARRDSRIKVCFREQNGHISLATNSALELARGDFIALLDHDDLLAPEALLRVVHAINEQPNAQILYSDEDKVDMHGRRSGPYFKCDWNYELFLGQNMISHLGVYRADLVRSVGAFRPGYEGSQDYDLALRCIERIAPEDIVHIPYVLYHWRTIPGSTALGIGEKPYAVTAAERALDDHLGRTGRSGRACYTGWGYRIDYSNSLQDECVTVVVPRRPTRENVDSLVCELLTLRYVGEIVVVGDGGDNTISSYGAASTGLIPRVLKISSNCPFGQAMDIGVSASTCPVVLVLSPDVQVDGDSWLREMLLQLKQPGVGVVGACLRSPQGKLIDGPKILDGKGGVFVAFEGCERGDHGYFGRASLVQSLSAVSSSCMLFNRVVHEKISEFAVSATNSAQGVDFCSRVRSIGYRVIWTPYAELVLKEQASEKLCINHLQKNSVSVTGGYDFAYSPHLARRSPGFFCSL